MFVSLLQFIEDEWLLLVDCIENGIIPNLEQISHVRTALEVGVHRVLDSVQLTSSCRDILLQALLVPQSFGKLGPLRASRAGQSVFGLP